MQRRKIFFLVITLVVLSINGFAQRRGQNLHNFEHRKFYFGTHLGMSISTFKYSPKPNLLSADTTYLIGISRGPGLAIHLPSVTWAPIHMLNVRLLPSISFHETYFNMSNYDKSRLQIENHLYRHDATNLNFPLLLKLNAKRLSNFSAYSITGFSYSYNLQNQEDVDQSLGNPILKISKHDFGYHVGGGFDFYMPYFKFGIELRLTNGVKNLLIQDNTFFSKPLESLKSQIWWFSITFEG